MLTNFSIKSFCWIRTILFFIVSGSEITYYLVQLTKAVADSKQCCSGNNF